MMKTKLRNRILGIFLVSTVALSCTDNSITKTTLSNDLILAINKAESQGVNGLIMPESNKLFAIPADPKNPISKAKVALGQLLFHETSLGIQPKNMINYQTYSCASCHSASAGFQSGMKQGIGEGGEGYGSKGEGRHINTSCKVQQLDVQPIRSPSAMNGAYQEITLWNGQFGATGENRGTENRWLKGDPVSNNNLGYEGLETQAIAGFSVHRLGIDTATLQSEPYKSMFAAAFPDVPEQQRYSVQFIGLAIAAYERTLLSNKAPFQKWLKGDYAALTDRQIQGALVFFGKGQCYSCHKGPALNSMAFYALGLNDLNGAEVMGSVPFDVKLGRGGFTGKVEDQYKFKVPQLYNLKDVQFFGHGASMGSVREIIEYKNKAASENANVPPDQLADEFYPLQMSDEEISALVDFVENGLYDPDLERYEPTELPSGFCFPNNDSLSRIQRGCN